MTFKKVFRMTKNSLMQWILLDHQDKTQFNHLLWKTAKSVNHQMRLQIAQELDNYGGDLL